MGTCSGHYVSTVDWMVCSSFFRYCCYFYHYFRHAINIVLFFSFFTISQTSRYEPGRRERDYECRYNENKGYVVFSAMGSFFIPMTVMIYVYIRISCVIARRHDQMAEIEVHKVSVLLIVYQRSCYFSGTWKH